MRNLREEVPKAGVPEEARAEPQQGQGRDRRGQSRVWVRVWVGVGVSAS